ncbi:branched-chain amino acid ABC transporter permease [Thalassobacillus sp. C254]|uniref:branched-chain amino acid ABC transporter permease n=1 Tax=Thalassobacillus sp. C254 TaxID=1225341 RepID=UPI0006D232DF|nr:branched-chain amino acid ABC transporter permease [Thalassobacillus sp. C254]
MTFFKKNGWLITLAVIALLFPLILPNQYFIQIGILIGIWSIAVYGLNLITGYIGQLSLAHAGFFAIGAYSLGLLTLNAGIPFWAAFFLSLAITAVFGLLIGLVALRTKSHFFAIYTMSVGFLIYLVIYKWDELTGGVRGLIGISAPDGIGPVTFQSITSQYYFVIFFLLVTIFLMRRIVHSLLGRTFTAIRNSEDLAKTIGISVMKNKLLAFVLSSVFAGLAGILYASYIRFLGPEIAYIEVAFEILLYLLVGGIGTLAGPLVGTIIVVTLTQSLQFLEEYRMLIFGPIVVLLILFYPQGIVGQYYMWKMKRNFKKKPSIHTGKENSVKEARS